MRKSSLLIGPLWAAALVLAPAFACAADITPSTILSNTQSYDAQSVSVAGTVKGFSTRQTRRGTVSTYQVCDDQCVNAVDPSGASETNGNKATVSGTFHTSLKTRRETLTNVIVVGH
jgi:hypothetical protein